MSTTFHADHDSPVGVLRLVSDGAALTAIYFEQHKAQSVPAPGRLGEDHVIRAGKHAIDAYFAGRAHPSAPPLSPQGTPFQMSVWALLREIPFGRTDTYGALAQRLGNAKASRAVGLAVGANPISILIPCHRVIGANGALTGFAGGIERKRFLLAHEAPFMA